MYSLGNLVEGGLTQCDVVPGSWIGAVGRAIAAGQAAWPGVEVDLDAFEVWLATKSGDLGRLHGADLYLAFALIWRDPTAIRTFDRELGPDIEASARAAGADVATAAEIRQQITADVLVGDGYGPRISQFGGRGDLRGWLRSIAVRTAWRMIARARRDVVLDEEMALGVADDPEIAHLRERYVVELEAAITGAMATLTARQRTLLRLAYVDGLSVDVLGRMYAIHRATAARWLAAAREALFEEARVRVQAAVGAGMTSVIRLAQSQVQLSLARLL